MLSRRRRSRTRDVRDRRLRQLAPRLIDDGRLAGFGVDDGLIRIAQRPYEQSGRAARGLADRECIARAVANFSEANSAMSLFGRPQVEGPANRSGGF